MILFNDLSRGFKIYKDEYEKKALEILNKGWYILGEEVKLFEQEFTKKLGGGFCAGVDNGLNAIAIGIRTLGIGNCDEVIMQSNGYIATAIGITMNGAVPVFVEPNKYYNIDVDKIEEKITSKTKAVLVTHLYGQASNMNAIERLCGKYNLYLLEDCAQSHFAKYHNISAGLWGTMSFFSFFPTKNLGCFGDGGAIVSNSEKLISKVKVLRNYGSKIKYYNEIIGYNSRLDELQAGMLRIKLSHIDSLTEERRKIATAYLSKIENPLIILPEVDENATSVWHLFVVRTENRDKFRSYLQKNGIGTEIHYPIPIHLSEAYRYLGYEKGDFPIAEEYANSVISLPMMNNMFDFEVKKVIDVVNAYE